MDKIQFIIPIYTLILIFIGIGYSIHFNKKYQENETNEQILGVLINISTISAFLIWCFVYLPKIFFGNIKQQNSFKGPLITTPM